MFDSLSFVRRVSRVGTRLHLALFCVFVGQDDVGNRYYRSRTGMPERRFVLYCGEAEASLVPPTWFGWLHHQCDKPLLGARAIDYPWMKAPRPNLTGTLYAYDAPATRPWHAATKQDEPRQSFCEGED